jgi:hypothetical protein
MLEENSDHQKIFDEAKLDDYVNKKAVCAGLGIKKSLLDSKAVHGGGPLHIKESGMLWYKKGDAIKWYGEYSLELAQKKEKLRVAVFSMANERQGNW